MESLGLRLKQARERARLTQRRAARLAMISQGHLCQIEKGEVRDPGFLVVMRLCRVLELHLDELVDDESLRPFTLDREVVVALKTLPTVKLKALMSLLDPWPFSKETKWPN